MCPALCWKPLANSSPAYRSWTGLWGNRHINTHDIKLELCQGKHWLQQKPEVGDRFYNLPCILCNSLNPLYLVLYLKNGNNKSFPQGY